MTIFEQKVLEVVKGIPRGKVMTYAAVAHAIGNPKAVRAVGNALNKNPHPITVPCHRVIRSNGQIGGYALGIDRKNCLAQTRRSIMTTLVKVKTPITTKLAYIATAGVAIGLFAGLGVFLSDQGFYDDPNVDCPTLTESACQDNSLRCQAIFDEGSRFSECKTLTDTMVMQRRNEAILCQQTQGQLIKSRFGPYCDCSLNNQKYVQNVGCQ